MLVRELIAALKKMPKDAIVVVDGYESGYSEINPPRAIGLVLDVNDEWYYGRHSGSNESPVRGVLIEREINPL